MPVAPAGPSALPDPLIRPYLRLDSHGAETLRQALAQSGGNKTRAAQRLGLTERQFSYRWRRLGLG